MPHWKGAGLSGSKSVELEETLGTPLGAISSSDDGSFLCVYSAAADTVDPGSDHSVQFELDAEDEGGVATYFPITMGASSINLAGASAASGAFTFRCKAQATGARLRVIDFGSTALGETYKLEVCLTRLPQPSQPVPHVIP